MLRSPPALFMRSCEGVSSTSRAPSQPHLTVSVVSVTALIASLTHRYAALDVNELLSGC